MQPTDQKTAKADELFFVVDENDQPLDPLPRKIVHTKGIWHRTAHVWIVNSHGELLCQQRALNKELNPGYWEAFFGGHVHPNETYEEAALRELDEELGIQARAEDLSFFKKFQYHDPNGKNNDFQAIFVIQWEGKTLHFKDGEVARVAWRPLEEVKLQLQAADRNKWTFCGYELETQSTNPEQS